MGVSAHLDLCHSDLEDFLSLDPQLLFFLKSMTTTGGTVAQLTLAAAQSATISSSVQTFWRDVVDVCVCKESFPGSALDLASPSCPPPSRQQRIDGGTGGSES